MNLRQLRYISEIVRRDLNISTVAAALHTAQPGISKQVRLLEDELGVPIFVRSRGRLSALTEEGARIVELANRALDEIDNIHSVGRERRRPASRTLVIATTHTQARYVLPDILKRYARRHPTVRINLRHGDPAQIAALVASGEADIGVTTGTGDNVKDLLALPYRKMKRVVIVPRGHPLLQRKRLTLKALARYPLVTYEPQFTGRRELMRAFEREGLTPTLFVSAIDADVIKTCVEQGLGIAVLSEVTYDPERDPRLRAIPAGNLFAPSTTSVLLHRRRYLQQHAYDFVETCVPAWTRAQVQRMASG
ncbi:MAG: Transcriptional regulator CysB [Betaproteobacteria bacterium]|nr:Transcriptional regulator CysB [Betaproteobacteria bacterium]